MGALLPAVWGQAREASLRARAPWQATGQAEGRTGTKDCLPQPVLQTRSTAEHCLCCMTHLLVDEFHLLRQVILLILASFCPSAAAG